VLCEPFQVPELLHLRAFRGGSLQIRDMAAAYAALPPLLQQVNFGAPVTVCLNFFTVQNMDANKFYFFLFLFLKLH
jgi:hypothetical protein